MEQKIKILVPDKKRRISVLEHLNSLYSDMNCVFDFSDDKEIHILNKLDTTDNLYCVIINVGNMVAEEAKNHIYDVMTIYKYDDECENCKFIFIPTKEKEDEVIKLTNTLREVPLMH